MNHDFSRRIGCQRFVSLVALALVTVVSFGAEPVFLDAPQYVGPPQPQHAVTNRAFQGIPSLAVTPGGRLWANWYAGKTPGEDQNNYVVLSTSGDNGATWREVLVVDPDGEGPARSFDPELWVAPDGKLRVFWAQAQGHEATLGGVWCLQTAEPESEQPAWEKPVRVTNGVMMWCSRPANGSCPLPRGERPTTAPSWFFRPTRAGPGRSAAAATCPSPTGRSTSTC